MSPEISSETLATVLTGKPVVNITTLLYLVKITVYSSDDHHCFVVTITESLANITVLIQ